MRMHFRVKHFDRYVGIFVILSLIIIVVALVFIARGQKWFERRHQYKAVFHGVQGLKAGTAVEISGVEVGSVKSCGFNSQGQVEVRVDVLDPYNAYVRRDSVATIQSKLLGGKTFEITMGAFNQPPLPEGGVIPSREPRELTDILKGIDLKEPLNKVNEALDHIKSITEKLNSQQGELFTTLKNLEFVTTQLKEGRGNIGAILQDRKMHTEISAAVESVRRSTANVEVVTRNVSEASRELPKVVENVKQATAQLPQVMGDIRKAAGDAPAITGNVKEITQEVKGITGDVKKATPDLPDFLTTAQETVEEADKFIQGVENHWLLRGLFAKPKKDLSLEVSQRESPYGQKGGASR